MNLSLNFYRKQLFLLFSCFFIVLFDLSASNNQAGIIDLRGHNFYEDQLVPLDSQWAFYWKELLSPVQLTKDHNPDFYTELSKLWGNHEQLDFSFNEYGYATYHTKVLVDKNKIPQLAISMPAGYCSYRLWIDGQVFLENGVVAKNEADYEPHWLPACKTLFVNSDTIDFVMQVANFDHHLGGMSQDIVLGDAKKIFKHRDVMIGLDLLLVGILLTASVFFFALYALGRKEKELLYFAIFCFVFIYRIVGVDKLYYLHSIFPNINWRITIHIEYFSLYLCVYLFIRFMRALYPDETRDVFIKLVSWLSILFAGLVVFTPVWFFTWAGQFYLIVLLVFAVYALYAYGKGYVDKRPGASFALVSVVILGVSVWLSILTYFKIIEGSPLYFSLGFLGFIFFQALILTFRFADSLHKARELAEQGAESKSQFLATMSHEIRTPLNGVLGMADLLEMTKLSSLQKEYLSTIKISGENLLNVINDILDFSKFESGNLSINKEETCIYELLDDVLAITSTLANNKELELFYVLESDVPEYIWSDEGRLKQVLVNLVNNALKFTEKGQVIIKVKVNSIEENDYDLKFEVQDTGIGIPESKKSKLFKSFSQVDSGTARMYGGTGLGLAICKQIVQLMDGEINVKSEVGSGSTFYFNIKTQSIKAESYFLHYNFKGKKIGFISEKGNIYAPIREFFEQKFEIEIIPISLANTNIDATYDALLLDINSSKDILLLEEIFKKRRNDQPVLTLSRPSVGLSKYVNTELFRILNKPIRITLLMEQLNDLFVMSDVLLGNGTNNELQEVITSKTENEVVDYSRFKILLAEDNKINQKVLEKMMEQFGVSIDLAEDGEVAVEKAKKKSYDLIFMDMQMPKIDGVEATKQIRALDLSSQPYIVALTANVLHEDVQKCLDAGMDEYLSKPVKSDSLKLILNKLN